jgi:predicted HAD superfamily Cof-like phosphohydrolase
MKNIWITNVETFNTTYNLGTEPLSVASNEHKQLLLSLIREERDELKEGITNLDPVETLDAIADLLYVVIGCGVRLGLDLDRAMFSKTQISLEEEGINPWVSGIYAFYRDFESEGVCLKDASEKQLKFYLSRLDHEVTQLAVELWQDYPDQASRVESILANLIWWLIRFSTYLQLPIQEAFAEVQASNMSKLGEDGKPIYRHDGKLLKGPNYFKPDFSKLLENYND